MKTITSLLLAWYKANARALPWRTTYEPYHIFISELMLQQTQMERGIIYFKRWIERFPTIFDVAKASEEEVLHAWEGLGYYRRARYIHAIAKEVCEKHNGIIPDDKEKLKNFKGIGDYTLAALCGIAFNQDIVTIDANVERVFSRLFCIEGDTKQKKAKEAIKFYAYEFLPQRNARNYNQALMELGALVCKKSPDCPKCPLKAECKAFKESRQKDFPSPKAKQKLIYEDWIQLIFVSKEGTLAIKQREKNLHWGGLFEFYSFMPSSKDFTRSIKEALNALNIFPTNIEKYEQIAYSYTNHKNTVSFFKLITDIKEEELNKVLPSFSFVEENMLENYAFPSPYRKAIKNIF